MESIASVAEPGSRRSRGKSSKAYEAFRARSIERRWSWRWKWAVRAAAWDDEQFRRADEATLLAAGVLTPSSRRLAQSFNVERDDVDSWDAIAQQLDNLRA